MYREFNLFEEDGRLISSTVTRRKKLGGDWVAFYKRPLRALTKEVDVTAATLKVYLYLASKQTFEYFVMTTPTAIAKELGLSYETTRVALKWLREHHYLQVHDVEGNTGYLLNPSVTTKGRETLKEKRVIWAASADGMWEDLDSGDAVKVNVETGEIMSRKKAVLAKAIAASIGVKKE